MRLATRRALALTGSLLSVYVIYITFSRGSEFRTIRRPECNGAQRHAIDTLLNNAISEQSFLESKKTDSIHDAASSYRARHGRHPPPGFDAWFHYAHQQSSLIIEDFYDQIYRDIEPFWGLEPTSIQSSVAGWPMVIKIRNGQVNEVPNKLLRTTIWVEMISKVAAMLPDMDIPINHLDEARVIAPSTIIGEAVSKATKQRTTMMGQPDSSFISDLTAMSMYDQNKIAPGRWSQDLNDLHKAIQASCPTGSALSRINPPWLPRADTLRSQDGGESYVKNMSIAKSICDSPEMTVQHGALVEPATVDFTTTLMPLFTGSKLPLYNDIIIPEPSYYSEKAEFTGKDFWGDWSTYYSWAKKHDSLVWRGSATGGGIHNDNWSYFHRQRLIARLNSTEVESDREALITRLNEFKTIKGQRDADFQDWLDGSADAGFTKLYCDTAHDAKLCPSLGSHYSLVKPIKMGLQYKHKYLPDVDGNSVSERFRAFLLSNSAPIKATIFDDWHDHRLLAWRHFIPMHISYRDLYDIMSYFLGYRNTCSHDAEGQMIADNGRKWAQQVLRKEDMVIYVHRVLLEYARVVHDDRDTLGYVADLLDKGV